MRENQIWHWTEIFKISALNNDTLYHHQIMFVLIENLFSEEGHLCILTTEALELILGELHISVFRSQRKNVELF